MCGIVGYIGRREAQRILTTCLARLEYRGYDSCGVAVLGSELRVFKDAIRVSDLDKVMPQFSGNIGIGHTRWATHGEPCQVNAHPHCDCSGRFAVVHNGIISNYRSLRKQLAAEGHDFKSETDSEVIPHLIEKYYTGDLAKAVKMALEDVEGSYAIIVVAFGEDKLVAARRDSPLVIGIGDGENFLASDVPAILEYTGRVVYLDDGDIATLTGDGVKVEVNGTPVDREEHEVSRSVADAQKGGYDHFMIEGIREQPKVIRDTLAEYMASPDPAADLLVSGSVPEHLLMLASGTSYHAAMIGKYAFQELLGIPIRVEPASEFNYYAETTTPPKAIVISQSGETADALRAIRRVKSAGCQVVVITNVVGSTASRIADQVVYTRAGPEISVAATKSFVSQLIALYWLAMPYIRPSRRVSKLRTDIRQLPARVQQVLDREDELQALGQKLSRADDVFFVGRGISYPVALEGALKLKEISYIHAEGYAAGELKHGPFALLGANTPVVAVVARDSTYEAMVTNIKEIKARRSPVYAITEEGDDAVAELADAAIALPAGIDPIFSPVVNTVALQLLAYHTAKARGCPIDFPKNLAKSVTVE